MTQGSLFACIVAPILLALACTSTPKGTPTSTKAAVAAGDAAKIGLTGVAVALGEPPRWGPPSDDAVVASSTRIETTVIGLRTCIVASPHDLTYELTDENLHPLTSGIFSQKWESITTAVVKENATYYLKLKSLRTGNSFGEKSLTFSGEAPWKIFVTVACPSTG